MKDLKQFGKERPSVPARDSVAFCLDRLAEDDIHRIEEELINGLTFEELIGALLQAQDAISELERGDDDDE